MKFRIEEENQKKKAKQNKRLANATPPIRVIDRETESLESSIAAK
jgi:hypothetical protein